jgi:Bacteriophage tail sheath protein
MPEYLAPGVYVEEINTGAKPIEGVNTSNTTFVGETERGPEWIHMINSWLDTSASMEALRPNTPS